MHNLFKQNKKLKQKNQNIIKQSILNLLFLFAAENAGHHQQPLPVPSLQGSASTSNSSSSAIAPSYPPSSPPSSTSIPYMITSTPSTSSVIVAALQVLDHTDAPGPEPPPEPASDEGTNFKQN